MFSTPEICRNILFLCNHYSVTLFLLEFVHKIVPDPPLVTTPPLHIEDFTRARVNESYLTAVLVETGAMPVPTKSQNPTACG